MVESIVYHYCKRKFDIEKEESPLDDLHEALNPNNSYKLVESK